MNEKARNDIAGKITDKEIKDIAAQYALPPAPVVSYGIANQANPLSLEFYGQGGSVDRMRRPIDPYNEYGVRGRLAVPF